MCHVLCKEPEKERKVRYCFCPKSNGINRKKKRMYQKGHSVKSRKMNKSEIIMEM